MCCHSTLICVMQGNSFPLHGPREVGKRGLDPKLLSLNPAQGGSLRFHYEQVSRRHVDEEEPQTDPLKSMGSLELQVILARKFTLGFLSVVRNFGSLFIWKWCYPSELPSRTAPRWLRWPWSWWPATTTTTPALAPPKHQWRRCIFSHEEATAPCSRQCTVPTGQTATDVTVCHGKGPARSQVKPQVSAANTQKDSHVNNCWPSILPRAMAL